jgi:hypothetical protein
MLPDPAYDDRAFLKGLDLADKAIREAASLGMRRALMQLHNDAITQDPNVPLDEGTLRGSASVHVNGKFIESPPAPGATGDEAYTGDLPTEFSELRDFIGGTLSFNTPYAMRLHEAEDIVNWSEPGSGPKFVEAKMAGNEDVYMRIVADAIRGVLK